MSTAHKERVTLAALCQARNQEVVDRPLRVEQAREFEPLEQLLVQGWLAMDDKNRA